MAPRNMVPRVPVRARQVRDNYGLDEYSLFGSGLETQNTVLVRCFMNHGFPVP